MIKHNISEGFVVMAWYPGGVQSLGLYQHGCCTCWVSGQLWEPFAELNFKQNAILFQW